MHSEILERLCFLGDKPSSEEKNKTVSLIIDKPVRERERERVDLRTVSRIGIVQRMNFNDLRQTMLVLKAVNHRIRKPIISLLENKKTMTISNIQERMNLEPSVVDQHLGILKRVDIIETVKNGKEIYCSLNEDKLFLLSDLILSIGGNKQTE